MKRKAIRLDILRQVLMDAPEVPESVKSHYVPTAEKEMLEQVILKYKVPIHERIDESYFREDPGLVDIRRKIQEDVNARTSNIKINWSNKCGR